MEVQNYIRCLQLFPSEISAFPSAVSYEPFFGGSILATPAIRASPHERESVRVLFTTKGFCCAIGVSFLGSVSDDIESGKVSPKY